MIAAVCPHVTSRLRGATEPEVWRRETAPES
jgi:hypothetical protein